MFYNEQRNTSSSHVPVDRVPWMVIGMDGVIRERERERARMSEDGRKTMSYKFCFFIKSSPLLFV